MGLILAGFVLGVAGVWMFSFVPGGAAETHGPDLRAHLRQMGRALADRSYLYLLVGMGLVTVAWGPLLSFVPLFMKERVGIGAGHIVLLDVCFYAGIALTSYVWGWASDRYGSKPVMMTGLLLMILPPLCWFLMPRHSVWSTPAAMVVALVTGLSNVGYGMGFGRYLFVSAVPSSQKMAYLTVYNAWSGLVAGAGPLVAGRVLDLCGGIDRRISPLGLPIMIDQFTPLFAAALLLTLLGVLMLGKVRSDGAMPTGKFVGMFVQGNPLLAVQFGD